MFLGLTIAVVALLLLMSAFFSAAETSLTAASRARLHAMEQDGSERAKLVNRMLEAPERIIGTVLIGNNLTNILSASITTSVMISLFGDTGVFYATAVISVLVVIFCEVLPKTYAIAYPDRLALALSPVMRGLIVAFAPLTMAAQWVVKGLLKLTPTNKDDDSNILAAHEEIRGAIDLQHKEGAVEKLDKDMLGGILDLEQLQVADVMIHRTTMEMINIAEPIEKIVETVLKSQYTRLPVWKGDPENIVGVLNVKSLMVAMRAVDWDPKRLDLATILTEAWFVPETTNLRDQLSAFLKRKAHVAFVVDEYGVVQGLLTLEDILEEIVGQISDETDRKGPGFRVQGDGSVLAEGSTPIRDLNREMEWSLPDEEATTIAGLVIHEAQSIPEAGQAFTFHGFRFEVLRKSRNRILLLRVRPPAAPAPDSGKGAPTRTEATQEPVSRPPTTGAA
jgi:Mg2+/Co2+ transporter CorB